MVDKLVYEEVQDFKTPHLYNKPDWWISWMINWCEKRFKTLALIHGISLMTDEEDQDEEDQDFDITVMSRCKECNCMTWNEEVGVTQTKTFIS